MSMESTYSAQRKRNMFSSSDAKPYKLSRSRIENFVNCPRCFYLDRKCGTEQPPTFPYTLNNAVDTLLKKEFDLYRMAAQPHPYLTAHGIDAIPFAHDKLDDWRMNQRGVQHHHEATNFIVTGVVDDIWINRHGELMVVDYKATSSMQDITTVSRGAYKRQMEIYQWLLRKNGFNVLPTGYFVYCNADAGREHFAGSLKFKISLLPYTGDDSWIEKLLGDIKICLMMDKLPDAAATCDYCAYFAAISKHVEKHK